jgi:predicted nucleic acid-binding protein
MIVVDTNIIAYRFIEGDKTEKVLKAQQKDSDWILPSLWRHEFLNVLSTAARSRILNTEQCQQVWKSAVHVLHSLERDVDMLKALLLSIETSISAYDAQYITLAQSSRIRCLTEDRKLLEAFPAITVSLDQFFKMRP